MSFLHQSATRRILDHLEKLPQFAAVCRAGSFHKAAVALHLSQPALSRAVKVLEEALDTELLTRGRRGVTPTSAGKSVLRFAEKLAGDAGELASELGIERQPSLTIGTHEALASLLWPPLVDQLRKAEPALRLELATAVSGAELVKQLKEHRADLILAVELGDVPGLVRTRVAKTRWRTYAAPRLISKTKSRDSLPPLLVMARGTAGSGLGLGEALETLGIAAAAQIRVQSLESAMTLAFAGVGIAVLPEIVAAPHVKAKALAAVRVPGVPAAGIGEHAIDLALRKEDAKERRLATTAALIAKLLKSRT